MANHSSECDGVFVKENLFTPSIITRVIILGIINITVIGGNMLVIAAVFYSPKLRTVTNFLIVSLAVADLLVGIVVLPYAISLEVLEVWIFGDIWCNIWLAVDVWMCTSSILNLCAISVDRYLAITKPVHYRAVMSHKRVKLLIASVWVLSFLICFPPLVGWNDGSLMETSETRRENRTFIPVSVAVNPSVQTGGNATHPVQDLTPVTHSCEITQCVLIINKGYVIYSALGSFFIPMFVMLFFYWKIYRAAVKTSLALKRGFKTTKKVHTSNGNEDPDNLTLRIHRGTGDRTLGRRDGDIIVPRRTLSVRPPRSTDRALHSRTKVGGSFYVGVKLQRKNHLPSSRRKMAPAETEMTTSSSDNPEDNKKVDRMVFTRLSRRNMRWSAKRFHSEAKATKTVGIIVGGFICCWLPFFTAYLTRAFCEHCIPEMVFDVVFWLGYCNSALNPLIYGVFSRDFRSAFKKILCRCRLKDEGVSTLIRQIHVPMFMEDTLEEHHDSQQSSTNNNRSF